MTEVITIVDVMYAGKVLYPKGTILKAYDFLPDKFALIDGLDKGWETGLFSNEYEIYTPSLENK